MSLAQPAGSTIEVKDDAAVSYTPGVLQDIQHDTYLVDTGKAAGGQRWVNWALVRSAPEACAEFTPELVRAACGRRRHRPPSGDARFGPPAAIPLHERSSYAGCPPPA